MSLVSWKLVLWNRLRTAGAKKKAPQPQRVEEPSIVLTISQGSLRIPPSAPTQLGLYGQSDGQLDASSF